MIIPVSLAFIIENYKSSQIIPNYSKSISNFKFQISKLYILLPTILYTAFWFTYSRSGLLGFAAAMGTFLIFLGKENLKRHWRPLLLVGLSWVLISVLTFSPKIASAATPSAQPQQPPIGSTVNIRLAVWKGTLELIKDNPLLGTGPETFAYSFLPYRPAELNQTAEWQFLFNKAHNEYLNIAACTGLLGLGAYLWIIIKFIFVNVRSRFTRMTSGSARNNILQVGLFSGWVGVVVSNFFGFSVVVTSLLFWVYMAAGTKIRNPNIEILNKF
jgi:O-antigen ligase